LRSAPSSIRSVNLIKYRTDLHTDHRSAILSADLLIRPESEASGINRVNDRTLKVASKSAHFLSDVYPNGAWTVSQALNFTREDGTTSQMIVGPDRSIEEHPVSTAYDLAIGLICFDQVFSPLECADRLHDLVGSELFWDIIKDDILRFIHWEGYDGLIFLPPNDAVGYLATGQVQGLDLPGLIARKFKPVPGKEAEAATRLQQLEEKTKVLNLSGSLNFADVCNGLFVSPETRRLLGLSEATPVGQIPRWAAVPALRLVQIARVGASCQELHLASMKLICGSAPLATVAFSVVASGVLASEVASYTLTGTFRTVRDDFIAGQPDLWRAILRFRDTYAGVELRKQIMSVIEANAGAELVASVDGGLRQALPNRLLQDARDQMSALLLVKGSPTGVTPAVFNDALHVLDGPTLWRKKTNLRFRQYLLDHKVSRYDLCPCGSCEKVKFCCEPPLIQ
jgi:hypothetical protein